MDSIGRICRLATIGAALLFAFSGAPSESEAGVLSKVRGRTKGNSSKKTSSRRTSNPSRSQQPNDRVRDSRRNRNRNAYIAGYGAGAAFLGPYAYGYGYGYRPWPYAVPPGPGVFDSAPSSEDASGPRPLRLQLALARGQGSNAEGFVDRYFVDLRVQSRWDFDLSTSGLLLSEPVRGGPDDRLALWKGTAWWRFVDEGPIEGAVGVGYRYLFDPADGEGGAHVAGSLRIYPFSPFVLEGRCDVGRIGEASHLDWRTSAGVLFGPVEVNVAWTGLTFDDITLSGPSLGLRLWL